jgi:hypothetical protein
MRAAPSKMAQPFLSFDRSSSVDFVLVILVVMAVGSLVCLFVIPPFLFQIKDSGEVNVFGIKFLGK